MTTDREMKTLDALIAELERYLRSHSSTRRRARQLTETEHRLYRSSAS